MKRTEIAVGVVLALVIAVAAAVVGIQTAQQQPQGSSVLGSSTASIFSGTAGVTSTASTGLTSANSGGGSTSSASSITGSSTIASTSRASSSSSSSFTSSQRATMGDFAMMATDPPIVASGVSAATVTYGALAVHGAGNSDSTGWVNLNGTGTIDLMSSANVSQTISAGKMQSGTYDMVRMGIQSASVTYNGKVYEATVASNNITSRLQTDTQVTASQSSAAIVDLRTFVINTANSSKPEFVFSATAKSTAVPPSAIASTSFQVGAQTTLQGSWWVAFNDQTSTKVSITSATLTSGSLSIRLKNSGNSSAEVQSVVVMPLASSSASAIVATALPTSFSGSAIFSANGSDSLQASNSLQVVALLGGNGTQCIAGCSMTLDYNGSISLGFGVAGIQLNGVVAGQQYLIIVMGANTYSTVAVTAQ